MDVHHIRNLNEKNLSQIIWLLRYFNDTWILKITLTKESNLVEWKNNEQSEKEC